MRFARSTSSTSPERARSGTRPDLIVRVSARVHFVHAEAGERMLEQHHILRFADGHITGIDPLRTGLHQP